MKNIIVFVPPIPHSSHNHCHRPITQQEINGFKGVFIVLLTIFAISIFTKVFRKNKSSFWSKLDDLMMNKGPLLFVFWFFMAVILCLITLFYTGFLVGKLL